MTTRGGVAAAVIALVATLAGGGDDDASRRVVGGDRTGSPTAVVESDAAQHAAVDVCRQVVASAAVMVRDYNAFMRRLNETHSYDDIGSEDRWAAETLSTGADVVRQAIGPDTPTDLVDEVSAFVDDSEKLAERIERHQRTGLNRASRDWSRSRTAVLDSCSEHQPGD